MRPKHPDRREGNPRGPVRDWVPTHGAEAPPPPAHLDDTGAQVWALVYETVGSAFQPSDSLVVARYCEMQDRRAAFQARLDEEGFTVQGSQGQDVLHPLARALSDLEGKLVALEDRLGFTINRVNIELVGEYDPQTHHTATA